MTSNQIRQAFLDFFKGKGHEIVPSSPVVPHDDPTLLFTNAGMNQFKDVFLGSGSRSYVRAADTQKCIRAGGKHNDLDDVGQDTYHHTFFEMLGNWSFGDYFKKEAISWAWELLTHVWGIEKDRLYATYFEGDTADGLEADSDAANLWREVTDIDPSHIIPGDKKDNFWEMGDTGPCGPCSEIHIDLTPDKSGGPLVNRGDHRVMEIWNLVFIQFNRDAGGKLTPLPAKHVDTGMGFERICAVLQNKSSNYDTDVFTPIFKAIQRVTGAPDYRATLPNEPRALARAEPPNANAPNTPGTSQGKQIEATDEKQKMIDVTYRVIADHIRCLTFALTDGAVPSNEGRGYVLRRILRRAVRYGWQYLDMHEPFLCKLVPDVVALMGESFPELQEARGGKNVEHVTELIRDEEESFGRTLERGIELFEIAARDALGHSIALDRGIEYELSSGHAVGSHQQYPPPRGFPTITNWTMHFSDGSTQSVGRVNSQEIRKYTKRVPSISGEAAFKLHDTFGFPIDLTELMAEENGLTVDVGEYVRLMEEARQRARTDQSETTTSTQLIDEEIEYGRTLLEGKERVAQGEPIASVSRELSIRESALEATCDAELLWVDFAKYIYPSTSEISLMPPPSDERVCIQEVGRLECESIIVTMAYNHAFGQSMPAEGDHLLFSTIETCFYAEQGGQVSDTGSVITDSGEIRVDRVTRTSIHIQCSGIVVRGTVDVGQQCKIRVDWHRRWPTMQNHTATHLLNLALRDVLGDTVDQKGSLVDPEKTRFDFSHNKPVTDEQLARIEQLVRRQIEQGLDVYAAVREEDFVDQHAARKINTLRAVFGEKYPDRVRVVSIGVPIEKLLAQPDNPEWMNYSVEFCGGTHVANTREIEAFCLVSEEGVAKGVRRVVGVSGDAAKKAIADGEALLAEANALEVEGRKSKVEGRREKVEGQKSKVEGRRSKVEGQGSLASVDEQLPARVADFQKRFADAQIPILVRREIAAILTDVQKALRAMEKEQAAQSGGAVMDVVAQLLASAATVGGVTVVVGEAPAAPPDALRGAIDWVRNKTESSAVLLAMADEGKVTLVCGMSKDAVKRGLKAGDLIKEIAPIVGGRGGGRPDMAQGGGTEPSKLGEAVAAARDWITSRLG